MRLKSCILLILCLVAQPLISSSHGNTYSGAVLIPPAITGLLAQVPSGFSVLIHPDTGLYIGDLVSLVVNYSPSQLAPTQPVNLSRHHVQATLDVPSGPLLGSAEFSPGPDPGSYSATLQWVWDTSQSTPGRHSLTFLLPEDQLSWVESIELLPRDQLPENERASHWSAAQSACCTIHYLTGTDSARDIEKIKRIADSEAQSAASELHATRKESIQITLLPRVLGQGGFTSSEIQVSYLDRNYSGSTLQIILHHEMVHWFDQRMGGDLRPDLFVEGLATALTGGHFKPEPVVLEAAAALQNGWYIPLGLLADHFYSAQHEISYLEAAALISYVVNTWGWDAFNSFYRDIHPIRDQGQAASISAALKSHFGITLDDLDARFTTFLAGLAFPTILTEDISLTVRYYDTVRSYQRVLDPSAYFRQVWLPNTDEMRKRGITADLLRHPDSLTNREIEDQLILVDKNLRAGSYDQAETALTQARQLLSQTGQNFGLASRTMPIQVGSSLYLNLNQNRFGWGYRPPEPAGLVQSDFSS